MIERALLVIHQPAATGHNEATAARLQAILSAELGPEISQSVELVAGHPAVAAATRAFLARSEAPALVIAGGGGGTLRAMIEAVCQGCPPGELPPPDRIRVAALRMGSGNVLAKQFGVPWDSEEGLRGIVANVRSDRTAPCCIMRFEVGRANGAPEVRYAATLGGFGQFGRVPGDLARWRRRLPALHKLAARAIGVEPLTNIEYGLALLIRSSWCALRPGKIEEVEIDIGGRVEVVRLLAGALLNFQMKALPFDPGVRAEEAAVSLHCIPFGGRLAALGLVLQARRRTRSSALRIVIREGERLQIGWRDRDVAEFFLDEDPMTCYRKLSVQVAGRLAFVPGPLYDPPGRN